MAPMMVAPCDARAEATVSEGGPAHAGVADHALAPAHLDPARLELRLHQHHEVGAGPGQVPGQHRGHRRRAR